MKKLYGSSSAFQWGQLTFTNTKAGCLRAIFLQSRGVRETSIPEVYQVIGALNEEWYRTEVLKEQEFKAEEPIKRLLGTDIEFSGRIDYLLPDEVIELKAVTSYAKSRDVIAGGNYAPENLAQLVSYMMESRITQGQLIYTWWKDKNQAKSSKVKVTSTDKTMYEVVESRSYKVEIDEFGRIIVDQVPSKFTVHDQLAHRSAAVKCIEEGTILNRPIGYDAPFGSPCTYCVFKEACDSYDEGTIEGADAFINLSNKCLKE